MKWNVPNVLTIIRLLLIGVFLYLFLGAENYIAAVVVYSVAAVTDVLDGYIARKYNQITDFGKLADPLADKLMLLAALFCLTYVGYIHWIFLAFVVVRDLALIIGSAFLLKNKIVVYARIWGKLSTVCFNTGIVLSFLTNYFAWIAPWHMVVLGLAVVFGIMAFVQYASTFFKSKKVLERGGAEGTVEGADRAKGD
ncbi:MAG: CDP-diacylglycerol--glycerol-3-phosphate 3-phosphatidyltransferase [Christensenellales bacterium]|jgi:cardiolipin synthase